MSKSTRNISDLESLDREIHRLRLQAKDLEQRIDQKLEYLQDHYSSMTLKSVLPLFLQRAGVAGSILQVFLQNKRLKDNLGKLTDYLFDKISDGLELLSDKLSPTKQERL